MSLKVVQVRSGIGSRPVHRATLKALGLGRIGKSNVLPDRPEIHGMVVRVRHLVSVSEVSEVPTPRRRHRPAASDRHAPVSEGTPAP